MLWGGEGEVEGEDCGEDGVNYADCRYGQSGAVGWLGSSAVSRGFGGRVGVCESWEVRCCAREVD